MSNLPKYLAPDDGIEIDGTYFTHLLYADDIVLMSYLKCIFNIRKQTPTLNVYAETGRFPLTMRQTLTTVNYWAVKNLNQYMP